MSDFGFGSSPTMAQLQTLLSNDAPPPEATAAAPGAGGMAARDDHKHPRLTSATVQVLDSNGGATVMFTRSFTALPAVTCLLYEAGTGQPVVFKVKSWVQDASSSYTGCVIQGSRAQTLPSMGAISLLTSLVSALTNYNVFGGSAAGAQFCCIALQPSA